jgi:hypothetical protein
MIAVTIQHMEAAEVQKARSLQATPLSIVQKKVCSLLLAGRSQQEIAARAGCRREHGGRSRAQDLSQARRALGR